MKQRVSLSDFNTLWTQEVQSRNTTRMTDDGEEQAFWKGVMAQRECYAPDPSTRQVITKLLPLLEEHGVKTALEFGPGWGNYTLDLASACQRVDCVDISADVLDFILRIGAEQGYNNLYTHHIKWEDFVPSLRYDLAFGYNCFYRQADLRACFEKMNYAAKRLCVVGMNTGLAPTWLHELEATGVGVNWEWKDYIYFVNILYDMGIDPNVIILPFEKCTVYPDEMSMLRGECTRLRSGSYDENTVLALLRRHIPRQTDGTFKITTSLRSALVWWKPQENLATP